MKYIVFGLLIIFLDIVGFKLKLIDELYENVFFIVFDSILGMEKEVYKLLVIF